MQNWLKVFPALAVMLAAAGAGMVSCAAPERSANEIVPFPESAPPAKVSTGYTLDTPVAVIAADPKGAAVLNKDIPGLLRNPNYEMFKSMNLKTLASLSGGKLDEQTLAQTKTDLAALPKEASAAR